MNEQRLWLLSKRRIIAFTSIHWKNCNRKRYNGRSAFNATGIGVFTSIKWSKKRDTKINYRWSSHWIVRAPNGNSLKSTTYARRTRRDDNNRVYYIIIFRYKNGKWRNGNLHCITNAEWIILLLNASSAVLPISSPLTLKLRFIRIQNRMLRYTHFGARSLFPFILCFISLSIRFGAFNALFAIPMAIEGNRWLSETKWINVIFLLFSSLLLLVILSVRFSSSFMSIHWGLERISVWLRT